MLHFFRKIRHDLIDNSKSYKYFKYGIGEIVLVVVGILIALQVNNWNEERKNKVSGLIYLERIKEDLISDTISFSKQIDHNIQLRNKIKKVLIEISNKVETIEEATEICNTYDQSLDQVFSPNDNTYRGMINSGKLHLINNVELLESITKLYSDYDKKNAIFNANKKWLDGIAIHIDTHTDIIKFSSGNNDIYPRPEMLNDNDWQFLNNPDDEKYKLLIRAFSSTAWDQRISNEYYNELIPECKKVLTLITTEIEK